LKQQPLLIDAADDVLDLGLLEGDVVQAVIRVALLAAVTPPPGEERSGRATSHLDEQHVEDHAEGEREDEVARRERAGDTQGGRQRDGPAETGPHQ
jgi:hypothetical protein